MIRTRFAPAPTGPFHVGNARTALFNYLFAKKHGGVFVVRIEDTDIERSEKRYENEILDSLEWLGIHSDENPIKGGPYAPYRQSERLASYTSYLEKLLAQGGAYFCPHSDEELAKEKQKQLEAKQPPIHRCPSRDSAAGEYGHGIIRFKTPAEQTITFNDLIRGVITFESNLLGDFSIAKDLSSPLYNFAVVIDDQSMQISHVIRGEDHISNTPKQILIQETLGFPRPQYAHLPLILGPDRSKLSARHGATSISEFKKAGYLPEALVNFMALLGWNPGRDQEIFSLEELIKEFDLAKVQKSGAVFNIEKLDWMNGEYIRQKSLPDLVKMCVPFLKDFLQFSIPNDQFPNEYIEKVIELEQPRLKKLSEIGKRTDYFFREPEYDKELLHWKNMSDQELMASLEQSGKIIFGLKFPVTKEDIESAFLKAIGTGDKGRRLWPLRAALSGKKASPGPFEIMAILGKEKTMEHLALAKEKL